MTRALSEELSCRELVEMVTAYFDGAMDIDERTRFEHHVVYCGGCRSFVDQLRAERKLLAALPAASVPDETRERLLDAFRKWKAGR